MKLYKTIALIGGTGKSGRYVLNELLSQAYSLKVLVRHPEQYSYLKHPAITLVKGDARNPEDIEKVVMGCDAVISTLGQPKGEASIFSQATHNVLSAMKKYNINRYILTTGLNVNTPYDQKSPANAAATQWMYEHFPETTADKQKEYEILTKSKVNWTMVRLPMIELTEERRSLKISLNDCPGPKISVADLAVFLEAQLSDETYLKQTPFISS